MSSDLQGRALIEHRYGALYTGEQRVTIAGVEYDTASLLFRMGIAFDDAKPIDIRELGNARYVVRYYDAQDGRVVAQEFDSNFRPLTEVRAHIAEWEGEGAYFAFYAGH